MAPAPRAQDPLALSGRLVGRYRVLDLLGQGGMGAVYEAEDVTNGRHVALKALHAHQARKAVNVRRFEQEARAASAIGHPNICLALDFGALDDGTPFLVMEKLEGRTLASRIEREGGLPFDDVLQVVGQLLAGLGAAHRKGVLHRDVKPENVFLTQRPVGPPLVKILDFGVSKFMPTGAAGEGEWLDLTRTGMVMGTPYYMSPEQARGERNLDGRVDVYATGVLLYEALAGRRPFLAPNYNALLMEIVHGKAKPLRQQRPDTPPELERVVHAAMARDRAERPATALELARELERIRRGLRASVAPRAALPSTPPRAALPSTPPRTLTPPPHPLAPRVRPASARPAATSPPLASPASVRPPPAAAPRTFGPATPPAPLLHGGAPIDELAGDDDDWNVATTFMAPRGPAASVPPPPDPPASEPDAVDTEIATWVDVTKAMDGAPPRPVDPDATLEVPPRKRGGAPER